MKSGNKVSVFYAGVVFLLMCVSNRTLFTEHIPGAILLLLYFVVFFFTLYYSESKIDTNTQLLVAFVGLLSLVIFFKSSRKDIFQITRYFVGYLFSVISVILLSKARKQCLLEYISNFFVGVMTVSIVAWVLHNFLFSIPVFEYVDFNDDVHYLSNNYFFYDNAKRSLFAFPRFMGVFIEPGQLATPCVYLFFARGGVIKDWKNIVLLIAIVISFSLAGYITLFLGFILKSFIGKRIKQMFLPILIISGVIVGGFFIYKTADENNPFFSLIVSRLEYDEESGISGNNRTTDYFDSKFEKYVSSNQFFFGIGDELEHNDSNWTNHASGIKKYIVIYGLFGLLVILIITILLLKINFSPEALSYFIIVWTAFVVRDCLQTQMWFIIAILGFYNLSNRNIFQINQHKYWKNE